MHSTSKEQLIKVSAIFSAAEPAVEKVRKQAMSRRLKADSQA
jgi:hypothetical protein